MGSHINTQILNLNRGIPFFFNFSLVSNIILLPTSFSSWLKAFSIWTRHQGEKYSKRRPQNVISSYIIIINIIPISQAPFRRRAALEEKLSTHLACLTSINEPPTHAAKAKENG